MTAITRGDELERFRALIGERLGLWMEDGKLPELSALLARRASTTGLSGASYLALIEDGVRGNAERRALAEALTVGETFFFRQSDQIATLVERFGSRPGPLRVLSLGCASGEEPYSIAIALREKAPQLAASATIRAIDINGELIERAKAGKYSPWALRETSEASAHRWFRADGRQFQLSNEILGAVQLEQRNLIDPGFDLFTPSSYDAVFFRNVLMYFTLEAATAVIAKIARALAPAGLLFLGYAETLRGLSTSFHLRHARDTFYYEKRGGEPRIEGLEPPASGAGAEHAHDDVATWPASIERSAARIRALEAPAQDPASREAIARVDLQHALQLMREERFDEALAALPEPPEPAAGDPEARMLRAALLVHSGKLEKAREACMALLAGDELNAGAHYLLGLVCEATRDSARAAEHHRVAAYLDPSFAMPRLRLGLIARRAGDAPGARRDLRQACALLERDQEARLSMFAGGFERAALIALCRAELLASGGAP